MRLLCQDDATVPAAMFRHCPLARAWLVFSVTAQALAGIVCLADQAAPAARPPSQWITPRPFKRPLPDDAAGSSRDFRWLLTDRQINAQNDEEFVHEARLTLTSAGVEVASHILIRYDPTCQSLTLHWARIWRGTNKLDRLDPAKLRVSQAGTDVEESLFNARKTAILLLDDVRVGDIVDYAYTIEGSNPALDRKFFGTVQLQFREPVDHAVTRLVWPSSRRLYITNHLTNIHPAASRKGDAVEFTWDVLKAPALRLEPGTPVWYDPYPWVQLSELPKWSDVNQWALRLFSTNTPMSPELKRKIGEWKLLPQPETRALAALRFVQEEIHNAGIDEGPVEYKPAQPSVVFARGHGNGNDKSLLLVAILRSLKFEAFPVLVNDYRGRELAELHPSPALFDRVLVKASVDGQSFWLDPAAAYQRGGLALRAWPSYGWGLRVGAGVTGLTPIPLCPVEPKTTVTEYLNLGDLNSESMMKIVTVAEGPDADALREHLATTPREEIERETFNVYAGCYPFIRRTSPLVYTDDGQQNRIEMTESYAMSKVWSRLPGEVDFHCRIYAVNVDGALVKPAESFRAMPLALPYPVHQVFHAKLNVTTFMPIDASNATIRDPAFYFQRTVTLAPNDLLLNYEYRSTTDAVAAGAVPAYMRDVDSATAALGYTVIGP